MRPLLLILLAACSPKYLGAYGRIEFTTPQGVEVLPNLHAIDREALGAELEAVARQWELVLPGARRALHDLRVRIECLPFRDPQCPSAGCAGLYVPGFHLVRVGWAPEVPWDHTALAHEVGHHILWMLKRDASEEGLRSFTERYKLPY